MIISVINKKGGVGKTPIAYSLAKDLGLNLQSNDGSVIEDLYDKARICSPILQEDTVYDFGGFTDAGVLGIIKESNVVFVPCHNDYNALKRTIETIEELQPHNDRIAVIVTKVDKDVDYDVVEKTLSDFFEGLHFFRLKNSKIFKNSMETGLSVSELYMFNPLNKAAYKSVFDQYEEILNILK
jgi:cellulose biosynthesis protein BcsQ